MLALAESPLHAAEVGDLVLMGLGTALGAGYLVRLHRRGELKNPLAGISSGAAFDQARGFGPRLASLALVVCLYLFLTTVLGSLALRGSPRGAAPEAGSHQWHLVQSADGASRLIVCLVMIGILRAAGAPVRPDRAARPGRVLLAGLVAAVAALPICAVQLKAGTVAWQWLHPGEAVPVHPVLKAAHNSAWGTWGTVQLLIFSLAVAPLAEELFFRGMVLQAVWGWLRRAWPAVIVSAVAFGCVHGQPQDILPLCTLGLVLGYLRLRSGSLAACVVCHALFNARTMILLLFFPELIE